MNRPHLLAAPVLFLGVATASPAFAAPASSITQYGVTWTFDHEYETGRFATGDYWVVGPVTIQSVTPTPTGTRNGSCVNPRGGRQGYDDRGGEFGTEDQVAFPYTLTPDQSLVSSVSKPEGVEIQNAGNMISQAVLTAVAAPPAERSLRPAFAGTYKRHFGGSDVSLELLPNLPPPASAPSGAQLLLEADRPRADHLSSWTIQNSCAEENWNNGPGEHACYGREVSAFVSSAALYVMLDTPERDELAWSLIQLGIDNYGILRAGGRWAPNGGHHSGRKWPIVFAALMLSDCDMLAVGTDYDDSAFGEDGQTYIGAGGKALFGWDCGGGQGAYFENGCSGSGAKDCRDPAGAVDGCLDYRNCCTSAYWVGQMLSTLMIGGKSVWNHDAYFDYVDRWMSGDVEDGDGADPFTEALWTQYRNALPPVGAHLSCIPPGDADAGADGGDGKDGGAAGGGSSGTGGRTGVAGGSSAGAANGGRPGTGGRGGATSSSGGSGVPDAGATSSGGGTGGGNGGGSGDDGGCGCRTANDARGASPSSWLVGLFLSLAVGRRRRALRPRGGQYLRIGCGG